MSNSILESLVKQKDYSFKTQIFKMTQKHELNVFELQLIIFFINQDKPSLDIPNIKNITLMEESTIMEAFTTLTSKKLLAINIVKENNGTVSEVIDLTNLYKEMVTDINITIKKQSSENIFNVFEREFGRTLSPIEFEIINAWLKSGMSEELIIGALKEATYNGVSNLRYIDKIIYEWNKKGFKKMEDVDNHLKKNVSEEAKELFDYNWLEDDD